MRSGRRSHQQSKTRDTVSLIFGFFLSVTLVFVTILATLRIGIMTENGILSVFDDEYYEYLQSYVEEQSRYYTLPTGIDPIVLNGVYTTSEIKDNVRGCVVGMLNGFDFQPDVAPARERLLSNVRNAFAADGVIVGTNEGEPASADEIATSYANQLMGSYATTLKPTGVDVFAKVSSVYCRFFPVVEFALAVFALMLTIAIVRLHHYPHRSLRYIAYALGGAALAGIVLPSCVLVSGFYKGLNLVPQHFYHFGVTLVERVCWLCITGAAVLMVAAVCAVIASEMLRKHALHRHHKHHKLTAG